jgi:hypothetical protein
MKKQMAQKWVDALRSGKYKQGHMELHNKKDNTFCCLGVLDDLYPELNLSGCSDSDLLNFRKCGLKDSVGLIQPGFRIDDEYQETITLAYLNDNSFTFDEIADIIQIEYIEGV